MQRFLLFWLFWGGVAGLPGVAQPSAPPKGSYRPYYGPDTSQVYALAVAERAAVQATFGAQAPAGSAALRAHYQRVVKDAADDVFATVRTSALPDALLQPAAQQVLARIRQANPQLGPVRVVLTRDPSANASTTGSGLLLLHVGLLAHLENESQLAFVLCHELAHQELRHSANGLRDNLNQLYSKEMKRAMRRIAHSDYNRSSKYKALEMSFSLSHSYYSRQHERQADSLGYRLLSRTPYAAPQAHRALQLLDRLDDPDAGATLPLDRFFGCPQFVRSLNQTAPAAAVSIFAAPVKTAFELSDTLKTHPDCGKRMRYLRTLAPDTLAASPAPAPVPAFEWLRAASRAEVVQSWFDAARYDHALYEALRLLRDDPRQPYLQAVVQLCLLQLRQRLAAHTFTEAVALPAAHHAPGFAHLLRTLHQLSAADYAALSACFAQNLPLPAAATDEYALAGRYAAAQLAADNSTAATLRQQLGSAFPKGHLTGFLFPRLPSKTP